MRVLFPFRLLLRLPPVLPPRPRRHAEGAAPSARAAPSVLHSERGRNPAGPASAADHGNDVTLDGTVLVPEVGAPVLLTTWAYWPLPPREITSRSCILMPLVTGTWKPW